MQIQISAINKIDRAIGETKSLMSVDKDPLFPAFLIELTRYRSLVESQWPLDRSQKDSVDIGRVAVRELDESYPDYVSTLCKLGSFLREEDGNAESA